MDVTSFNSINMTIISIPSKYSIYYTEFTSLQIEKSSIMVKNDVKPCLEIKR